MMQVAIIGASGFIGRHMVNAFAGSYEIIMPDEKELDITRLADWDKFWSGNHPDVLVFLAGCKDVKQLEKDWDFACRINVQPVRDCLTMMARHKSRAKIIYLSSDYVFDGTRGHYTSDDQPAPRTNYGKTKLQAEQTLQASSASYKIIRTAAVMGEGGVFFDWLVRALQTEDFIEMYDNVYFSPTDIHLLLVKIKIVIEHYDRLPKRIIHIAGDWGGGISRYDYACWLKDRIPAARAEIRRASLNIVSSTFHSNLSMVSDNLEEA